MDYGQSLQVPQQEQPSFSSAQNITMNPLLNYGQPQLGTAGGTPLTMANGGSANLVEREKYGLGSKLKKFVRNIIPNEVSKIATIAAPFVAPFNPLLAAGMAGIGGFDQTGRIGSSLKSAALTYGAGQIARGIGGAGFQEGFNPFAGADFSGGFTSGIGSLFSSPMGTQPFGTFQSNTPTQNILKAPTTGYTGGVDLAPSELTGRTAQELQSTLVSGGGLDPNEIARSSQELIKTYGTQPGTEPGYIDLIKKAGSLENVPLSERFNAVKDLSSKALTDLFTKPIPGQPGKTQLDKTSVFAVISGASSYYEALQLAKKAGIPEGEFSEADYQRLRVDPEKSKFTSLKPGNFGIRPTVAGGGLMNEGVLSIKLTPAQAMAMGGRIGYQVGGLGSMDPMLALQRSPIDQYGYSDPVISALTGNRFTSGQRFRDVFSPQAGLMMQQAQAAGYSEPEMEELRYQQDFFPSFQRSLDEAYFGPTFQADPQKSAIDLATSIYNQRFQAPPSVQQQQRQPVQYQYSDRGTMIEQLGYQPGQLTPELQSQIDQYKRALNRVESIYDKPMANISGPDYDKMPYGNTGGYKYTPNQYLRESLKSEQEASARVTPKKAKGGRINYPMGNEIPVRQNQGGISELDLRAKGGYIPVGIKEKADDVPAMLSRNEFVFTADAVRGAGNGSINKGAQKMYKLMKSLEKKIKQTKVA
jgi:hypothetical protein